MGQITLGEQASPATPTSGVIIYPTIATPSIPMIKDDSGNDWALARVQATGSWTPGVSFGGGVTGITYSVQVGSYIRLVNWILFWGYVRLSAKGSSTGNALVTGLPVAARTLTNLLIPITVTGDDLSSISGHLQATIASAATTLILSHLGTGTDAALTHSNFGNTSLIRVSGAYEVA